VLTKREKELLDELPKHRTVKEAAAAVGMKSGYAGYVCYSLRAKLAYMERTVKMMHLQMKRDPLTRKVLTPKE
jgi:hypothetical protein